MSVKAPRPETRPAQAAQAPQAQVKAQTAATSAMDPDQLRELTEKLAYQRYEERGCIHGCDLDDWLTAEQDVRERLAAGKP